MDLYDLNCKDIKKNELKLENLENLNLEIEIIKYGIKKKIILERRILKNNKQICNYIEILDLFKKWYSDFEEIIGITYHKRVQIPVDMFKNILLFLLLSSKNINFLKLEMFNEKILIFIEISKYQYYDEKLIIDNNQLNTKYLIDYYLENKNKINFDFYEKGIFINIPCIEYVKNYIKNDIVYNLLQQHEKLSRKEIQDLTGFSRSLCGYILRDLMKSNKILQMGSARATYYIVNKKYL